MAPVELSFGSIVERVGVSSNRSRGYHAALSEFLVLGELELGGRRIVREWSKLNRMRSPEARVPGFRSCHLLHDEPFGAGVVQPVIQARGDEQTFALTQAVH